MVLRHPGVPKGVVGQGLVSGYEKLLPFPVV